jgi:hypothetical protein
MRICARYSILSVSRDDTISNLVGDDHLPYQDRTKSIYCPINSIGCSKRWVDFGVSLVILPQIIYQIISFPICYTLLGSEGVTLGIWSDILTWHSFWLVWLMIFFVVPVLEYWCSRKFDDLDWYHCYSGYGDVCASCDLKILSSNGLYEREYYILRLCCCHLGGSVIWILTLYSSLVVHRVRVCDNHLRLWRRWVSFELHESITHFSVSCSFMLGLAILLGA